MLYIPRSKSLIQASVLMLLSTPAWGRDADFGQQWVRQNPFTIMGSADGPYFSTDQYHGAGLNVVFSGAQQAVSRTAARIGDPWHVNVTHRPTDLYDNDFSFLPYGSGIYVWDEMAGHAEMASAAAAAQYYRNTYPDKLIYVNAPRSGAFPNSEYTYDQYLDDIVHVVGSDVLMFDMYPFRSNGSTSENEWFTSLMAVRNKALANHLPYWGWLQSFNDPGLRTPSESDTRFNGFTLLTAGYTGLSYFTYDRYPQGTVNAGKFFDTNGTPTPFYHYAASANAEYANIGRSLRYLTSTDVRFVPGQRTIFTPNSPPTGLSNWSAGAGGDPHILSLSVDAGQFGSSKNGLLGLFTDDDGERYFMLTNLNHGANLSAAAASLSFTLTLDDSIDSLWQLDRATGVSKQLTLDNHVLNWTLPGGTGDLFKYANGDFAGMNMIPPPPVPPAPGQNLLVNGSWEDSDTMTSWTQTYNIYIGPAKITTDSRALDGNRLLSGTFPNEAGEVQYEDRTLNLQYDPDTLYTFTAYAFTDNSSLLGRLILTIGSSDHGRFRVTDDASGTLTFTAGDGTVLADDGITLWNKFSVTIDTSLHPELVGRWITPTFGAQNAYVDRLSFTAIPVPEPALAGFMAIGSWCMLGRRVTRRSN